MDDDHWTVHVILDEADLCRRSSAKRLNALHLKFIDKLIDASFFSEAFLGEPPGRAVFIVFGSYSSRVVAFLDLTCTNQK